MSLRSELPLLVPRDSWPEAAEDPCWFLTLTPTGNGTSMEISQHADFLYLSP